MFRPVFAALFVLACSTAPEPTDAGAPPAVDAGSPDAGHPGLTFRLRFVSDIPESIYVQQSDYSGYPAWVVVKDAAGAAVPMFRPCDVCDCAMCEGCGVCGAAMPVVKRVDNGGEVTLDWDAVSYPRGSCGTSSRSCSRAVGAVPGAYVATFCWGTAQQGEFVSSLVCKDVPFDYPVAGGVVAHTVDNGG